MASGDRDPLRPRRLGSPTVKQVPSPENVSPDTEQNVVDQTEDVFQNFLYQSWQQDHDRQQFDATPSVPQLTNFTSDPLSPAAQVGRRLAKIGDDINQKYQGEFDSLINNLNIDGTTVSAYDAFAGVAKKLLSGGVNWGRILTLFSFGYRIAVRVIGFGGIQDFAKVLKNVVSNVVKFITDAAQGIARWIALQGGWSSSESYVPSISWQIWTGILVTAAATVGAVLYLRSGNS